MSSFTKYMLILWIASTLLALCNAQSNAGITTPFLPSSWPLAVKGPYLNSWQAGLAPGKPGTPLPMSSPAFWPAWDDQSTWRCIVVVDNTPYRIMGSDPANAAPNVTVVNQIAVSFTATRTSFVFAAGPVDVTATFLSPVTPNDLMRQSMPFAYFYLDISSVDGATHNIRVYTDINPQWLHGGEVLLADPNPKVAANASLIGSSNFVGLQMQLQEPQPFFEIDDHAQDVIGVYAMKSAPTVKYQVGLDVTVRAFGLNSTGLQNTVDTNYSAHALDNPFDAYAISVDLGTIQSTSESIMWAIGMLRDPSINLTTASGANQLRSSYYWSNFSSIPDVISFVLDDFDTARSSADAFDQMLQNVTLSHVAGYTDLLALAARQVFGALEITVSKSSDGTWNQSDVMIFSKDMGDVGSTGTTGGTNVVDVLYAGFPAILFLNADLGQYLLRPLLESQVNNGVLIGQAYAPQNLGSQFPNVLSNTSPHNLGIEESGNMLVMVLAHLQATQDQSIVQTYYTLLKSWADYLVNQTLDAGFQSSSVSDAIASFNQTNLVLKGIIGISAMSKISAAVGEGDDHLKYQETANSYMQTWLSGALSQDQGHLLSSFGNQNSNGLIYNMYADKLLGLNLVPTNVSQIQSGFYESLFSANRTPYGIPLDSGNPSLTRLDWTMFSVASTLDDGVTNVPLLLQSAVSALGDYAASQKNNSPLAVVYNPDIGAQLSGSNSLAVGSLFAPLVMGGKSLPAGNGTPDQNTSTSTHKIAIAPIVGGVVGGACALLISGLGFLAWRSRRWRSRRDTFGGDQIVRDRGRNDSYDLSSEARSQGVLPPSAENLISPFEVPSVSSNTRIPLPQFIPRREKYPPPPESAGETASTIYLGNSLASESGRSGSVVSSEPPNTTVQRLDGRLADLMVEIQMVRNAVQNRPAAAMTEDGMSEAPPSYVNDNVSERAM